MNVQLVQDSELLEIEIEPKMEPAEWTCSLCLSICTHPVKLICGDTFCKNCIEDEFDCQQRAGVYTCPVCRNQFESRPELITEVLLDPYLSSQRQQAEIVCIYCEYSAVPAVKTCVQCESSFCDNHLRKHNKSLNHILIEPTASLGGRKCSIHREILKYFCCEDATCICTSCSETGKHKGHQTELLTESYEKKKLKLQTFLEKLTRTSKREVTEERLRELQKNKRDVEEKAAEIKDRVNTLVKDIREHLNLLEIQIMSDINGQKEHILLQITDQIQQLEMENDTLCKRVFQIKEYCNIADPLILLRRSEPATTDAEEADSENGQQDNQKGGADNKLDEVLITLTLERYFHRFTDIMAELKVKGGFHFRNAHDISLELNTAAGNIVISDDLKQAHSSLLQVRDQRPERFKVFQVLSTRSFSSGQHFWEVETSQTGHWKIGVTYPSILRETEKSYLGYNEKSWCLRFWNTLILRAQHNYTSKDVHVDSPLKSFGIYLDYEAGVLSFYQLSDPIRHLHTFTTTFTEPLHAAFFLHNNSWVKIKN
ncbi:hypothetical protein FKM82_003120 [Ascaphus truei]